MADASAVLERLLQDAPRGAVSTQAKMLLGNIRLHQNAYQDVVSVLAEVVDQETGTEGIDQARLDLASAYVALGKGRQAVPLLEDVADSTAAPDLRRQAYEALVAVATQAGDSAGMLYIGIEYANLEAFAKGTTKASGDDEWAKLIRELDASGMREVMGNSLMVEATP